MQHQTGKGDDGQTGHRLRESLIIARHARKRAAQAKERSTTQRRGSNTRPHLRCGSLTISSRTPAAAAAAAAAAGFVPV